MNKLQSKPLGIIFHSGSYDRVHHGLAIALTALALGRDVRMFFTYYSLECLRKPRRGGPTPQQKAAKTFERKSMGTVSEFISQAKELGAKLKVCSSSARLLDIDPSEMLDEVDEITGLASFLAENEESQILFI